MHSIKVEQLVRHFGKNVAVDDISFNVESGEIFGFLGPNGAGKTTTMNLHWVWTRRHDDTFGIIL